MSEDRNVDMALIPTINGDGAFGEVDLPREGLTDRIRRAELNKAGEEIGEEFFRLKFYTRYVGEGEGQMVAILAVYVSERFAVMDKKSKMMYRPNQRNDIIDQYVNSWAAWLFTYGNRRPTIVKEVPVADAVKIEEQN